MPRTTIDIDVGVLRELKRRKRSSGKSIGEIASELLATALAESHPRRPRAEPLRWKSAPMGARVDLADKEALRRALDGR